MSAQEHELIRTIVLGFILVSSVVGAYLFFTKGDRTPLSQITNIVAMIGLMILSISSLLHLYAAKDTIVLFIIWAISYSITHPLKTPYAGVMPSAQRPNKDTK